VGLFDNPQWQKVFQDLKDGWPKGKGDRCHEPESENIRMGIQRWGNVAFYFVLEGMGNGAEHPEGDLSSGRNQYMAKVDALPHHIGSFPEGRKRRDVHVYGVP